jgi:CheY-like chemotaxis protein/curved DNA-binding protein CbpA
MAKKILIGLKDHSFIEILHDFFSSKGYDLLWCRSGHKLKELALSQAIDLIISDALLADLDALQVASEIKSSPNYRGQPFFVLSDVYKDFKMKYESADQAPIEGFLEKPINLLELEKKIIPRLSDPDSAASLAFEDRIHQSGNFEETEFVDLLVEFHRDQKSGLLSVDMGMLNKLIYFERGNLVYIYSNLPEETFGRFLIDSHLLSEEDYQQIVEEVIQTDSSYWNALMAKRLMTPHKMAEAFQQQSEKKLIELFAWHKGRYYFLEDNRELVHAFKLNINLGKIIFEGIKTGYDFTRMERIFENSRGLRVLPLKNPLFEPARMKLNPLESRLFDMIDGKRRVDDCISQSKLNLLETFMTLLAFVKLGFCSIKGIRAVPLATASETALHSPLLANEEINTHDEYVDLVERLYENLHTANYFEVLGIPATAGYMDIKVAYHKRSKLWRNYDYYMASDKETKFRADSLFQLLTEAYENLIDKERREGYLKSLPTTTREKMFDNLDDELSYFQSEGPGKRIVLNVQSEEKRKYELEQLRQKRKGKPAPASVNEFSRPRPDQSFPTSPNREDFSAYTRPTADYDSAETLPSFSSSLPRVEDFGISRGISATPPEAEASLDPSLVDLVPDWSKLAESDQVVENEDISADQTGEQPAEDDIYFDDKPSPRPKPLTAIETQDIRQAQQNDMTRDIAAEFSSNLPAFDAFSQSFADEFSQELDANPPSQVSQGIIFDSTSLEANPRSGLSQEIIFDSSALDAETISSRTVRLDDIKVDMQALDRTMDQMSPPAEMAPITPVIEQMKLDLADGSMPSEPPTFKAEDISFDIDRSLEEAFKFNEEEATPAEEQISPIERLDEEEATPAQEQIAPIELVMAEPQNHRPDEDEEVASIEANLLFEVELPAENEAIDQAIASDDIHLSDDETAQIEADLLLEVELPAENKAIDQAITSDDIHLSEDETVQTETDLLLEVELPANSEAIDQAITSDDIHLSDDETAQIEADLLLEAETSDDFSTTDLETEAIARELTTEELEPVALVQEEAPALVHNPAEAYIPEIDWATATLDEQDSPTEEHEVASEIAWPEESIEPLGTLAEEEDEALASSTEEPPHFSDIFDELTSGRLADHETFDQTEEFTPASDTPEPDLTEMPQSAEHLGDGSSHPEKDDSRILEFRGELEEEVGDDQDHESDPHASLLAEELILEPESAEIPEADLLAETTEPSEESRSEEPLPEDFLYELTSSSLDDEDSPGNPDDLDLTMPEFAAIEDPEHLHILELLGDSDQNFDIDEESESLLLSEFEFKKGEEYLAQGKYPDASAAFQRAITFQPTEGEFYAYLGWSKHRQGNNGDAAKEWLAKSLEIAPNHYIAHLFLGLIFMEEQNFQASRQELKRALDLNPTCHEAINALKSIGNRQ